MKDGFVKTAAAAPELRVADCAFNAENIIAEMRTCASLGVKLLVLPELCITGYTCGDLFSQDTLLSGALDALKSITDASAGLETAVLVGLPFAWLGKLYNCAAVVCGGHVLGLVPKKNLPNYAEFYELRNFTPAFTGIADVCLNGEKVPFGTGLLFKCEGLGEFTFAAEICEDLWVAAPPSVDAAEAGATVICNLSASDETVGKREYRRSLVSGQSARLFCAYIYSDAGTGESTTDMVFSGHHIIAENGRILAEAAPFSGKRAITEIDVKRLVYERRRTSSFASDALQAGFRTVVFHMNLSETQLTRAVDRAPFIPADAGDRAARCEEIISIQAHGLARRISHVHAASAVVGISGGLDSCLALLIAVHAMDMLKRSRRDIVAVTMPCFGTTKRTKSNALLLCEQLGVTARTVEISDSVRSHFADIGHDESDRSVVYENAQARERTQVLMDIANAENGLVIGTGDLSELALGWATYNGDHMSMYGVNASVPKTLVRHIVAYEADCAGSPELAGVLRDILATPVSPELLPADKGEISQKTEELVGPYELHDFYLYNIVRCGFTPEKVLRLAKIAFEGAYSEQVLRKWLKNFYRRFFNQQFKRSCLPDGPKVGSVTLSPRGDWRMPSDAVSSLWLDKQ